jgi:lipopolysaccharide/colanic/teichoic acid biosynthesis glycosyltransferase
MLLKANAFSKKESVLSTLDLVTAIAEDPPAELHFEPRRLAGYDSWKVAIEFCACLVMLALAAPIILLASLLVKLTSRGPAFYTQTRLGLGDREYTIYKLRTMFHNCERQSGARWSTAGDPRITWLGRWLRRTHIDELPQLWNVLRGEMSLVGPRPERPEFIPHLEKALPLYRLRRAVRPGVTGLAQVQLPPDTDLESVRRKLAYDLYYVHNGSPWLDLQLLAATAIHVLGVPYALIGKILFLPSSQRIEQLYQDLSVGHGAADSADSAVNDSASPLVDMKMAPCV